VISSRVARPDFPCPPRPDIRTFRVIFLVRPGVFPHFRTPVSWWIALWEIIRIKTFAEEMAPTSKHLLAIAGMWVFFFLIKLFDQYDGISSLIGAPIVATFLTLIAYPLVMLLGQFLRIPKLRELWNARFWPAMTIALAGILALSFGTRFGLTESYHDSISDSEELRLHAAISIPAFLALFFCIAYWPPVGRSSQRGTPKPANKPEISSPITPRVD
jgi:hypothetical protein